MTHSTPDTTRHVIGWVTFAMGVNVGGTTWFSLAGTGTPDGHGLYATQAEAQQVVDAQKPGQGVAWLAVPVVDQGDSG